MLRGVVRCGGLAEGGDMRPKKHKARAPRPPIESWPAGRPVQVAWEDTITVPGWSSASAGTAVTGQIQYTLGFFLSVDELYFRLVQTQAEGNDEIGNLKVIPLCNVRWVMRMRPGQVLTDRFDRLRSKTRISGGDPT